MSFFFLSFFVTSCQTSRSTHPRGSGWSCQSAAGDTLTIMSTVWSPLMRSYPWSSVDMGHGGGSNQWICMWARCLLMWWSCFARNTTETLLLRLNLHAPLFQWLWDEVAEGEGRGQGRAVLMSCFFKIATRLRRSHVWVDGLVVVSVSLTGNLIKIG